jgi:hypothetical protein
MLGDTPAVLSDHDPVGVGVNLDWASDRAGAHRVFVVVETNEAGLRHRGRQGVETVEPAAIGNEPRPLFLEDLPDRSIRPFGMGMGLRKDQTSVEQPSVELIIAFEAGLWGEKPLADKPDLVLHLAFLPARRRRAGDRLNQMMRAHLQEAAIVLPVLADEDRIDRRFHVMGWTSPAFLPASLGTKEESMSLKLLANRSREALVSLSRHR